MADLLAFCVFLFLIIMFFRFVCFVFTPRPKPEYRVERYTVVRRVK